MRRLNLAGIAAAAAAISAPASAEWRCDCTTIIDSCNAEVAVRDSFIEVSTPAAQCARVDYFIDGMPFVSVAIDGSAREHWIAGSANPGVIVQSCQVCRDNATAPAAPQAATAADADADANARSAELTPLIAPEPVYPEQAQRRGVEGSVTLEFTVDPYGDTQNVRVVSAQPRGVFDLAAISAVSRWRYRADGNREPRSQRTTIEFSIDDFIFSESTAAAGSADAAAPAAGPSNQCIRENISYNYGEMIEVGLISACAAPVSLFACATGTGALAQRWVCTSTEDNSTVLVRPGDARRGYALSVQTPTGAGQFEYAENFFVARAPNTEYWWIACGSGDTRCRDVARRWAQSLDRQAAHIDPQTRTRLPVARSY